MFDTVICLIEENVDLLEATNQTESEVFLGVSILNDDANAKLKELGWTAVYVEQGIFQLNKL